MLRGDISPLWKSTEISYRQSAETHTHNVGAPVVWVEGYVCSSFSFLRNFLKLIAIFHSPYLNGESVHDFTIGT